MIIHDPYQAHIGVPKGLKIGITSGCFDMLHYTHVNYLNRCKKECDFLIVGCDADHLVKQNKGRFPVINEDDRMYMLESLKCVNRVVLLDSLDELRKLAEVIQINNVDGVTVMFKNAPSVYGVPLIEVEGVENQIIGDISRFSSTTQILDFIKSRKKQSS